MLSQPDQCFGLLGFCLVKERGPRHAEGYDPAGEENSLANLNVVKESRRHISAQGIGIEAADTLKF